MNNWVSYQNGNYTVYINTENGTKIRKNDLDYFEPEWPESADIKITNCCKHGCSMCHENSTPDGKHADILNAKFIETLHPYMELAIGGGNPLEHPDLEAFLYKCKDLKLIPSMTVHQGDFMENLDLFRHYRDEKLLYGIGVSVSYVTDELIEALQEFPNAVCHIIAGITTETVINKLAHNNLKILILGYKIFRRGEDLYKKNNSTIDFLIQYMYDILPQMINEHWFNTISFDNLAIEQLKPARLMSEEDYSEFYMGDDGSHTMFINMVDNEFTVSSTWNKRYPITDNIIDMFKKVKEVSGHDRQAHVC